MKINSNRNTLTWLISDRLAKIGASNIPTPAREIIEADALRACERVVQRTITGPRVGRAVARALVATPAAMSAEGSKGANAPLASRCDVPEARNIVAGSATDSTGDTATGEGV